MNKKVVVISTSLRAKSNSDILAESFAKGAKAAGNEVEIISLKDKAIGFCNTDNYNIGVTMGISMASVAGISFAIFIIMFVIYKKRK